MSANACKSSGRRQTHEREQLLVEEQRERSREKEATRRAKTKVGCLGLLLLPFIGLWVGGRVGVALGPKPDPNAFLDLTGVDWLVYGALIGGGIGLLLAIGIALLGRP
jgi:hypothetical protein